MPKRESLYDLRRDPFERNDLAATERDKVAELRAALRLLSAEFPKSNIGRTLEMSDEEMQQHREKLRALGYLE